MKLFRWTPLAAFACAAVLCCGAESCDEDSIDTLLDPEQWGSSMQEPKGVVSIHSVIRYRRGDSMEKMLPSYFGDDVCVAPLQLLDSGNIKEIQAIPIPDDPGFYNLKLKLSDRGRKLWIGLSVPNKGTQLAFVIDGMVYRGFVPRLLYNDTTDEVIVDGPFDQATAMELQNQSKRNYKRMEK